MNMYKKIEKKCHEGCDGNGFLKKVTVDYIKKLNEQLIDKCNYCPFDDNNCKICGGLEDILFLSECYNCNKCNKWSISEKEYKKALYDK